MTLTQRIKFNSKPVKMFASDWDWSPDVTKPAPSPPPAKQKSKQIKVNLDRVKNVEEKEESNKK